MCKAPDDREPKYPENFIKPWKLSQLWDGKRGPRGQLGSTSNSSLYKLEKWRGVVKNEPNELYKAIKYQCFSHLFSNNLHRKYESAAEALTHISWLSRKGDIIGIRYKVVFLWLFPLIPGGIAISLLWLCSSSPGFCLWLRQPAPGTKVPNLSCRCPGCPKGREAAVEAASPQTGIP